MPFYALTSEEIPVSQRRLFLGKGFRWLQKHTQRLRDTLSPYVRSYVEPSPLYYWARQKEQEWEHHPLLGPVSRLFSINAWWNPVAPLPPVGGSPQLHAVGIEEKDIWMDLGERVGHMLVLGTTRVGR